MSCSATHTGENPSGGLYYCTLKEGHSGDHIAQGVENQVCWRWPQDPRSGKQQSDPRGSFEFLQGILANSDETIESFLDGQANVLSELLDTGSVTVECAGRNWEITLNVKEAK